MSEKKDFWKNFFEDEAEAQKFRPEEPSASAGDASDDFDWDDLTEEVTRVVDGYQDDFVPDMPEEPAGEADNSAAGSRAFPDEGDDFGDTGPKNFKVDFDFDGEYKDASKPMPLTLRKEKRTGLVGGLLYGIFVICLGLIAGCILWMCAKDVLALGNPDSEVRVTIPNSVFYDGVVTVKDDDGKVIGEKDASLADLDKLSEIMYDNGLIHYKWLFKLYCRFSKADRKVGAGTYLLNTKYDYRALVYGTMPYSSMREEISVTIPEGFTLKRIFNRLEEYGVCPAEDLWATAADYAFENDFTFLKNIPERGDRYRLEGFLFPDTYYFYTTDDPVRVIKKFLNNFEVKFGETYIAQAEELGYSVYDIITIASMIEREASSYEGERDQIASVIYNRINSSDFYYLNIDATIIYAMARNNDEDAEFSTTYSSPYNTYTNGGLPPGPICNPGEDSIRGALYPTSTNYYYYALNKGDGTVKWHEFFTNYDSFLSFVNSDQYGG